MTYIGKPTKTKGAKQHSKQIKYKTILSKATSIPNTVATIRMYCHGLGDCFLLRFTEPEVSRPYTILIDCGIIGVAKDPKKIMEKVATDINIVCNGHLDLVIITHEHWDHVSGFSKQQAQAIFDTVQVDKVWYAWTEDPSPNNTLGKKLRREREVKAHTVHQAALALQETGDAFAANRGQKIGSLLAFFGYENAHDPSVSPLPAAIDGGTIGKTRAAFDYLSHKEGVKTLRYCHPCDPPVLLAGGAVRAFILGPPQDENLIKRSDPTKTGKEVYEISLDQLSDEHLASAFSRLIGEGGNICDDCPFDTSFKSTIFSTSSAPNHLLDLQVKIWEKEPWRQINYDWTSMAESLALNLDKHTNNTCLAVAFEIVATGQVLLFAADAQVGSWLSWQKLEWIFQDGDTQRKVTGPELLARTVLYKVGHHGSHNATLREFGLEQMISRELIALVPVDKNQAEKSRWHEMPFTPLINRLREKTAGRVILADSDHSPDLEQVGFHLSQVEKAKFNNQLKKSGKDDAPYWEIVL